MPKLKKLLTLCLINALLSSNLAYAHSETMRSGINNGSSAMLSPQIKISSTQMRSSTLKLLASYTLPDDSKIDPLELLQRQTKGPGGLLHLEKNYNGSRSLMRVITIFAGSILGAIAGIQFYPNLTPFISSVVLGGTAFGIAYSFLFPKSNYQSAEMGLNLLENASSEEHLKAAYALFEDAQNSELVTIRHIGITGLQAVEKLLEKAKAKQKVAFNLAGTLLEIDKNSLEKLKLNIYSAGLGEMFSIGEENQQLYLSVSSEIPTQGQRIILREAISSNAIFDQLFHDIDLKDTERILIEERFWHGFFDLLYRQDQNTLFTPEYTTLYKDGVIFKDPGVLRCLALDTKRSQEDFLVNAIKEESIQKTEKQDLLVFATGSGVLVNNILQNIPSVNKLIEYDRSQNSNSTADKRRKETLPNNLYEKVQQVTANVRDFPTVLSKEKFDFMLSTASLRLMSPDAKKSAIEYITKRQALKDNGSFFYMDTQEHSRITEEVADLLKGKGFDIAITQKNFAGHRDAMFYIFVHQYLRNPFFKQYINKLMLIKQNPDLYDFLYQMAGHRTILFLILKATQKPEQWQRQQFHKFVNNLQPVISKGFKPVFNSPQISIKKGPSSKVTISLLGKDANQEYLDSYDIFVNTPAGQTGKLTLYDGRSIGINTLIIGRISLETPAGQEERVIMTQHVLTSRYGYEDAANNLKQTLKSLLVNNIQLDLDPVLEKFSNACVGLTAKEITIVLKQLADIDLAQEQETILAALSSYPRNKYPSQELKSFPKSAGVIKTLYKEITARAEIAGYSSLTGLISLPDGLQNMVLYKKIMGFSPIIKPEDEKYFDIVDSVLSKKDISLKEKAWELSKKLSQLLVLIRKDIAPRYPQNSETVFKISTEKTRLQPKSEPSKITIFSPAILNSSI
ncbi:MAG: hypothetical protein V1747_03050 [Candidatus Omnitrophota bacterium]